MSRSFAKLAFEASRSRAGSLPPLVLMTDDERLPDPVAAALGLPRGSLVVVRAKSDERRLRIAFELARIARRRGLFLLIADDPGLAARFGADGVHFPEARAGRIAYWRARRPGWLFTASAHSLRAVAHASRSGADAVFLSPVFFTRSHPGRAALGAMRLRMIAQMSRVPVYALGGIDAETVARIRGAPIAGIAAIGALAN